MCHHELMRVLHLDTGAEMRGGQWQALRLIEGLAGAGIESSLLARRGSPLLDAARKAGCRAQALGLPGAALAAPRHDLVHAHDARAHTLAALVGGAPLLVARRVAFPIRSRWKYRRAAHYLAVSEFVQSVLVAGGVPESKISVVYDGVPLLEPAAGGVVLAPATGDPAKGAALARQAAGLAGAEVKFSSDLERDLAGAAIFLYLTHSEGLGSAALLAMAAGVPVIASRVGGLVEVVHHGETGLLVDNQPEAVAGALRQLLGNPELARRLGAAGRGRAIANFTVEHMVRRTMEVYRKVLA